MTDANRDERLAVVLDDMLMRALRGEAVDPEPVFREHEDLLPELRELWATVMVAEDCASAVTDAESPTWTTPKPSGRTPPDAPGGLCDVVGDYELLREIGRGGMGVVYQAKQKSLDRIVALKMILHGDFATEEDRQRFRREAESAGRLDHANIVPVYEVGEHEHRPYFSMRYVEGTTLSQRLADGPLPSREAAELLIPICRAVAAAHRGGILHRDLKPSNILLDNEGRPYVTDFGLAKQILPPLAKGGPGGVEGERSPHAATVTRSGAIVGTPGYMAPEQAGGRRGDIGVRTDVYSLGALLYAMLTGRAPFQAASPVDTVMQVLEQEPLPPRLLNPNADQDLEMIALKCLQKPADLRYDSADKLANDLEAYLTGDPVSARSSRFTQVISRAFRETHHAPVLENWGLLWMLHSAVLLVLCLLTNAFQWNGVTARWPYVAIWSIGLTAWAGVFWQLRRRAGPITFVERQIAHIWAGSMTASSLLFAVEAILDLPVLSLSPILGVISGMVFLAKAGILTGRFYFQAVIGFATGAAMAWLQTLDTPNFGITLFGLTAGASFFLPGLKYYRQRNANV